MDRFGKVGQRDVFGRWFVWVHPVRMRVVDAEKFETAVEELSIQAREVVGCNRIIPDGVGRDVFCGKRARNYVVLACQKSATFPMRLAAGVLQELAEHFAATLDGSRHVGSL